LHILKDEFGLSISDIMNYYEKDGHKAYEEIFQTSFIATGIIIYNYTLEQWLNMIMDGNF